MRLFNTVGPRQVGQYGMVLPRFVAAALKDEPLQVYGDGAQTRCFCHVTDVVDALVRLTDDARAASARSSTSAATRRYRINDLARRGDRPGRFHEPIEHITYEQAYGQSFDDMARRVPNLDRIRAAIGFSPRQKLDEIIGR